MGMRYYTRTKQGRKYAKTVRAQSMVCYVGLAAVLLCYAYFHPSLPSRFELSDSLGYGPQSQSPWNHRRLLEDDDECGDPDTGDDSLKPPELFTMDEIRSGGILLYILGVLYMFVALAIVCDEFFVPALEVIIETLNISEDVGGATFMAAGGSAPELCTSFIGTFIVKTSVGFGTIVGSAVFNVLFVIAMCAIFSKDLLSLTWWPLFRDCSYYAFSLLMLSILFGVNTPNVIEWWESCILLLLYCGYVTVMKFNVQLQTFVTIKIMGKEMPAQDNDVEMATAAGGDDAEPTKATPRVPEEPAHIHTFRTGFTSLLMTQKTMEETAALHIVSRIRGDVHATFRKVDSDNSGFIDPPEMKLLLNEMGGHPSEEEVNKVFQDVDLNKDGKISFEEFAHWYSASEDRVKIEVLEAFNKYDKDSSGFIDAMELKALLVEMHGESVNDQLVTTVMTELDQDHDGQLSRTEFEGWYVQTDFFHQAVKKAECDADEAEGLSMEWPDTARARIVYCLLLPITGSLYLTLPNVRKPESRRFFAGGFIGSILWIAVYSYFMVWWAEVIGQALTIPPSVMGLTILAAGTSIPDLLTSVIVAKQGEGDMAVSSSIGSNIFDILMGLPFPWLLYSITHGGVAVEVVAGTLFLSVLILFGMLVSIVFVIKMADWKLSRNLAIVMLIEYVIYVLQDVLRAYCVIPNPKIG